MKYSPEFQKMADLLGLTDEESGRLEAQLSTYTQIWIPPSAEVIAEGSERNETIEEAVRYPLPEAWDTPVRPGFRSGFREQLEGVGWTRADRSDPLLDFDYGLIHDLCHPTRWDAARARAFALKWGPLWWCEVHDDFCWQPIFGLQVGQAEPTCRWDPVEPVRIFRAFADQVAKLLRIASYVRVQGQSAPTHLWTQLLPRGKEVPPDLPHQRKVIETVINQRLALRHLGLRLQWSDEKGKLVMGTGLGVVSVIWLQVAQIVTATKGLCVCDGCGNAYIREGRRPAKGRRNYCPGCGSSGGYRAAKRLWARDQADASNTRVAGN